jgi:hypothetical protein
MNTPSGIPKCCPLEQIIKNNSPYVREDTMFIEIMIDFLHLSDDILCYASSFDRSIPIHRRYELIQQKLEKQAQQ